VSGVNCSNADGIAWCNLSSRAETVSETPQQPDQGSGGPANGDDAATAAARATCAAPMSSGTSVYVRTAHRSRPLRGRWSPVDHPSCRASFCLGRSWPRGILAPRCCG